ncbi:hypothetical protein ACCQ12_15465 [Xanthomonas sp. NCPPB 1068]|uniref:hypothetical protein n=1 Tax=Xanthomonas sp. NCPPB 1068 TaxID=487525 RepID=UPI003559057C
MRERTILFNGAMVRAILSGAKSQTRRAVKPRYPCEIEERDDGSLWPWFPDYVTGGEWDGWVPCPFGQPGDRLWVRETWADLTATHGRPWEKKNPTTGLYERGLRPFLWYAADGDQPDMGGGEINREPWRSSTSMPRSACRLVLEVTDVRVERLQAISEADAQREGAGDNVDYTRNRTYRDDFRDIWTSTGGDWDANPWVWVIGFKVIDQQAKPEVGNA